MSLTRKLELHDQYAAVVVLPLMPHRPLTRGLLVGSPPRIAPPVGAWPSTVTVEGCQVKRLSQSEMVERRCLGLCFNCNEEFDRVHNRVCQRIFLLDPVEAKEGEEDESEEPAAIDPLILLHVIVGVRTSETMQVHIPVGRRYPPGPPRLGLHPQLHLGGRRGLDLPPTAAARQH